MAHGLTRFDIVQIRRTARELREDYDLGRYDGPSTVMLSEGYAEVDFDPDDEGMALLTRRGRTVSVRMKDGPSRVGAKRKAGRKTSARKRVPSKRVANPRGTPKDADSLYRIRREPLNAGGYTAGRYGQYFGRGEPLFVVTTPDGDELHVRGADRQDAMRNFREQYKYHHGGVHRTARFFGEKRKVANPARKRKPAKRAPARRKAR